jgi:voltage-gated potassium channel
MEFTVLFTKLFIYMLALAWPLLFSLALSILLLGQIVGRLEKWSALDSAYWAFITATTVGYGDIRPLRWHSRVLSVCVAFVGLIFTGILVSIAVTTSTWVFSNVMDVDQVKQQVEHIISES